jgi:MFS family permease
MLSGIPRDALLLGAAFFLAVSSANLITPLLPLIQREFAIDYTTAGMVVSAFGIARLALDLPAGYIEHRFGSRRLIICGFAILIPGALFSAYAPTLETVALGRAIMGLGAAFVYVPVLTSLSVLAPAHARARVLVIYSMSINTSISVFPIIGGLLGDAAGWRAPLILCAVLCAIGLLLVWPVMKRVEALAIVQAAERRNAASVSTAPDQRRLAILAMTGCIYFGVIMFAVNRMGFRNTAMPLFGADRLHLDPLQIATGISLMSLVGISIAMPGSFLADRFGRWRMIILGFLALSISSLGFLYAVDYPTFLLAAVVVGLSDFFSSSQTAVLTESIPPGWRGRVLSGYRFSIDLGATIGPLLTASMLQGIGYEPMVWAVSGLLLLAACSATLGWRLSRAVA